MTSAGWEGEPRISRSKDDLRNRLRSARRVRELDPLAEAERARRAFALSAGARVVAAYASVPGEPGTSVLLESLRSAGVDLLLPLLRREPDWAWYQGPDLQRVGPLGIPSPPGPALGPEALAQAEVIWLPGLAGTWDGRRLGTGGGWYDRALAWASPRAKRGLLLFDDEVLDDLPVDPWDQEVHLLVTERREVSVRPPQFG